MSAIICFLGDRELTTSELRAELDDITRASLYRHVALLVEATNRLRRHSKLYRIRLSHLPPGTFDCPRPGAWNLRQIAHHVAEVTYYARQVGALTAHPKVDLA
jgi:hypothetical protein